MTKQKGFWASFAVLLLFFLQSAAWGEELTRIRREIQNKGARWQAGETSMTRLSPEERQKRLGFIPPVLTGKEPRLSLEAAAPLAGAPASLDWRNNGGNFVTPIRDQGACGSCWAFAVTAALESSVLINTHTPGVDLDLSEQVVVSCSGAGSCNGGSPMAASNFIRTNGLPLESCYPYTATDGACGNACPNWQGSTYRIAGWAYVTTGQATVDDLKTALNGYGPLPTIFAVYEDFLSYQSGVYHYVTGGRLGLHVVLIVGYDDPGQYFIVKNSWGTGWGESGFFRIAYSELDSVVGFGDYTYALYGGSPLCSYSVSNLNPPTIPAAGGYGSSSVTSDERCPWTAASNASWIFLTSANIGLGNGTVTFSVIPNTGESRTGTLTIAGWTVTIV